MRDISRSACRKSEYHLPTISLGRLWSARLLDRLTTVSRTRFEFRDDTFA